MNRIAKKGRAMLCALGVGLGLVAPAANAQTVFPPAELGGLTFTNADSGRILVAQADQAQLLVRIQQLEEQIRLLTGQIEGLTFQLTQMQELVNRMSEDNEFRFSALEGGGAGKTDAATQPGGVTRPEALPQDPAIQSEENVPTTVVPEQGVRPLPGEMEFDPTFDDGTALPADELGQSGDPLVGTGQPGGIDLITGAPLDLSYDPRAVDTGNADADAQFAAAYEAFIGGDLAFAEDQFTQFIGDYPDNPRAVDAANWLGEVLLARGASREAAEILLDAYQKQPNHVRAPDLLLKIGVALVGFGERETACNTFAQIEQRYSDTTPAFKARLGEEKASAQCPSA